MLNVNAGLLRKVGGGLRIDRSRGTTVLFILAVERRVQIGTGDVEEGGVESGASRPLSRQRLRMLLLNSVFSVWTL